MSNNSQTPIQEDGELDLKAIIGQLSAKMRWIAGAMAISATLGAFWGQISPSLYESKTVVQIETKSDRIQLPSELIGDLLSDAKSGGTALETEIHIIQSMLVLQPVVERINHQTIVSPTVAPVIGDIVARGNILTSNKIFDISDSLARKYARPNEGITAVITDPLGKQVGSQFLVQILGPETFSLRLPSGDVVLGTLNNPVDLPNGATFIISEIDAPAGREYTVYLQSMRNSVAQIRSGLSIRERGKSGVVDFSFIGLSAQDTVLILNAVVDEYIGQNLRRRSVEIDRTIGFIEDQLSQVEIDLSAANAALVEFRSNREIGELSVGTTELLKAAVDTEAQLDEISFQKEQLLQVLTTSHPDVVAIESEEARLKLRLEDLKVDLKSVPEFEQELTQLVQNVERSQTLKQQLKARIEQLRIVSASAVGNIRVLEPAEVAFWKGPNRHTPILIGAALGFFISSLIILLTNFLRNGIEDARDIEALGLPLLATINKAPGMTAATSADAIYGLAIKEPESVTVEALRGLRTGLKFSMSSSKSKSIMITSCAPSDGKSFISLNLALVSGQTGARVLLIDADMRRGVLRKYFGLSRESPGLSDMLSGGFENCIRNFPDLGIDFLSTGRFPPNPAELLDNDAFSILINEAEEHYDLIVVDAPPVLSVSDPVVIGQRVGITMLVVRHLYTSAAEIQGAQKMLLNSGIRISGVILNQFDHKKTRYGSYGMRYGNYYGGYEYKYETRQREKD